jgi:alpha-glucosidase
MKYFFATFFLFSLSFISFHCFAQQNYCKKNKWLIYSPDNGIQVTVSDDAGSLYYYVVEGADTVIRKSKLGIVTEKYDFSKELHYVRSDSARIDKFYTMTIGKRKYNHELANKKTLHFRNYQGKEIDIIFRVSDDGVAFRYFFPLSADSLSVVSELTSFGIDTSSKAWLMKYGLPTNYAPAYENDFTNGSLVGQSSPDSSGWAFPALFNSLNHFVLITESDLDEHFFGSHLKQDCKGGNYEIRGPLSGEALGHFSTLANSTTPFYSPWRVIIVGKSLGSVIESNLVYDLATPSRIADTRWIKPGRSSWSWWGDHASSKNFTSLKKFIDLSREMGWEYSLVDANWDIMEGGGTIEDLTKYAKKNNILLTLWYNSAGIHNTVTERPREIMSDPEKRKKEFKKLNQWGVKAVKIDFFGSDKQQIIKLYLDILKDAAAAKIMVIFHGCTLPRGWSRTYPNLISMEAVKGAEQYGWDSAFANHAPIGNIILVCTRNVVGPMDYTPVTFSDYKNQPHKTSNAYELAETILFESGMLHFADRAEDYQKSDDKVKLFMKAVPSTWDDTRFIDGYPGKLMILARRKGREWFIGAANGEAIEKNVRVNLFFLPKGTYTILLMKDGGNPREIKSSEFEYSGQHEPVITTLPKGGFTMWIRPKSSN